MTEDQPPGKSYKRAQQRLKRLEEQAEIREKLDSKGGQSLLERSDQGAYLRGQRCGAAAADHDRPPGTLKDVGQLRPMGHYMDMQLALKRSDTVDRIEQIAARVRELADRAFDATELELRAINTILGVCEQALTAMSETAKRQ